MNRYSPDVVIDRKLLNRLPLVTYIMSLCCKCINMKKRKTKRLFFASLLFAFIIVIRHFREYSVKDLRILTKRHHQKEKSLNNQRIEVLKERNEIVRAICKQIGNVSTRVTEVSGIKSVNMSYCIVQKAGCTMWIRMIKFLAGQKYQTGDPMTISKYETHYKQSKFYKTLKYYGDDLDFITKSLRIMTVRDPYTRLLSAYIDKFLLPDFWKSKGRHIVKMVRNNPDRVSLNCGHNVTFPEFIQYVTTIGHRFTYYNQDKHWLPASDLCDPCVFNPNIIGKQETFITDMNYSLRQLKLDYLIKIIHSYDHTDFEIKDEIDYNLHIFPTVKECISKENLFKRLWQAFILNGYLPYEENCPDEISTNTDAKEFFRMIQTIRQQYNMTGQNKSDRRRDSLVKAFKQIDKEQIQQLQILYAMDFRLFNYTSDPKYLYPDYN